MPRPDDVGPDPEPPGLRLERLLAERDRRLARVRGRAVQPCQPVRRKNTRAHIGLRRGRHR